MEAPSAARCVNANTHVLPPSFPPACWLCCHWQQHPPTIPCCPQRTMSARGTPPKWRMWMLCAASESSTCVGGAGQAGQVANCLDGWVGCCPVGGAAASQFNSRSNQPCACLDVSHSQNCHCTQPGPAPTRLSDNLLLPAAPPLANLAPEQHHHLLEARFLWVQGSGGRSPSWSLRRHMCTSCTHLPLQSCFLPWGRHPTRTRQPGLRCNPTHLQLGDFEEALQHRPACGQGPAHAHGRGQRSRMRPPSQHHTASGLNAACLPSDPALQPMLHQMLPGHPPTGSWCDAQ